MVAVSIARVIRSCRLGVAQERAGRSGHKDRHEKWQDLKADGGDLSTKEREGLGFEPGHPGYGWPVGDMVTGLWRSEWLLSGRVCLLGKEFRLRRGWGSKVQMCPKLLVVQ